MSTSFALVTRFLLTATIMTGSAAVVFAQKDSPLPEAAENSASSDVVFHSDVRRVVVDVVVTDSEDKPVGGLSRDDFTVKEDGKPQNVMSFDAHDFNEIPTPLPKLPSLPANTWVNVPSVPEKGPLYVLLYDMVNMDVDDQATARKQLLKFISEKPAGARFAIYVFSDGLRLVQGFTADQAQLFAAMDPNSPRPHVPKIFLYGDNYGRGAVGPIVSVFAKIAHFLEGLPERKNVIWVTGSIPSTILATQTMSPNTDAVSYNDDIKEAINAMARSHVAVYPVDVRGVVITHIQSRAQAGARGSAMMTTTDSTALNASYSTEGDIATATGGRAFYSSNDLTRALTAATEAGANYYTLSYSPSNRKFDSRLRSIHVELAKRDPGKDDLLKNRYHLAYRRSYYADQSDSAVQRDDVATTDHSQQSPLSSSADSGDSLMANMRHGAPLVHQLFFGAHVHLVGSPAVATPEQISALEQQKTYSRGQGKIRPAKPILPVSLQTYAIDYTVSLKQLKPGTRSHGPQPYLLQAAAAIFDGDGQILISKLQRTREANTFEPQTPTEGASSADQAGANEPDFLRFQQQIEVPLGATSLRIAVRDTATNRIGALELALPIAPEPLTQADMDP